MMFAKYFLVAVFSLLALAMSANGKGIRKGIPVRKWDGPGMAIPQPTPSPTPPQIPTTPQENSIKSGFLRQVAKFHGMMKNQIPLQMTPPPIPEKPKKAHSRRTKT